MDNKKTESPELRSLEEKFAHAFCNPALLARALVHSSFANEKRLGDGHNERHEFLGDAALELCVSAKLFELFPHAREGELTRMRARLVSGESLGALALELGLDKYIKLGAGEEKQGGGKKPSILSDALEAVIGAVFEDGGYEAARKSVEKIFDGKWPDQPLEKQKRDNKSLLQQICQNRFMAAPVYILENSYGEEHAKIFETSVRLPDGRKFKAEQDAAALALEALNKGAGSK